MKTDCEIIVFVRILLVSGKEIWYFSSSRRVSSMQIPGIYIYFTNLKQTFHFISSQYSSVFWNKTLHSNSLHLKEFHICIKPDCRVCCSQVEYTPHISSEPHCSARVGLVPPD
eukprot:TRINITY_DN25813_c0_g1_i1.p1 TRINITY_DN25813_c0_g1~~TRINITY_DN25813_c0_g1_i1.p1  ORF type:complete len:113 (-),score=6.91 TRINITY_DN25813_c0_g1_i1:121-459(-)